MKKLILLIITISTACSLFSQSPSKQALDSARYQIIHASVEFIASDPKYGSKNPPCTNCKQGDFEILKKYATDQKLTGVLNLINEWKKIPLDTTEVGWLPSIEGFNKKVHDKIADGDKKERQKLQGYNSYKSTLDSIINNLKNSIKPQQSSGQEPMMGESKPDIPKEKKDEESSSSGIVGLLTWQNISLVSCIIIFPIVLVIIVRNNKKKVKEHKNTIAEVKEKRKNEIANLKWEIGTIEAEKNKMADIIARLESELKTQQEKFNNSRQQQVIEEQKIAAPPKAESKVKYACYADQGDGFSTNSLLNQSNSEAIFEINLTSSNTANYKISNNSTIQRYALSNAAFFLGTTCKYDTEPNSQQGIVTEKAGELKLQGNKWLITAPAIISFR